MNILLITSLYPGYKNQPREEKTWAIHDYAVGWQKQGHEVKTIVPWLYYPRIFLCSKKARKYQLYSKRENFIMDHVEVSRIPLKKIPKLGFSKKTIKNAVNEIKENLAKWNLSPQVILAHYADPSGIIGLELKRKLRLPLILGMHSSDISFYKKNPELLKNILENCDGLVFRSKKISTFFNKNIDGLEKLSQKIIPSGIKKENIIGKKELTEKIKRKTSKLITACSLIPLKNVDVLLKAFSKMAVEGLSLEIIGDGQEMRKLKALAKKLGINDRVEFKGQLEHDEVLSEMKKADIFALVSSPETLGIAYLEAMASGCIVVGSKGEGIDGIIKESVNGFLVKPKDSEQLRKTLSKIINLSQEEKKSILLNSFNTINELTEEKVSRIYIDFINKCRQQFL